MNRFSRLPIASQVLLTFGLICVFLAANGGLLFVNLRTVERRSVELQSRILPEQKIGNDVARNLALLQAEVLHHVLITDAEGMKTHDQFIRQIREENAGKLAAYEKLIRKERDRRLYARALQAGDVYFERMDSLLALGRVNESIEKVRLAVSAQASAYDEYQKAINEMTDLSEQEARELATGSTRLIFKTEITDALLLGLAIAIIIGTGFTVVGVARRLREDNQALQAEVDERKKAGEALRESAERMRAILESALDCIVAMDHQGRVVEFNPAAEKTFGYKRDATIGRLLAELIIPPALRERHQRGLAHYLSTGESPMLGKHIELTGMRSDNSEFPVELAIARIGSQEPPIFTGFMRDITERKQAEEALAEQALRYKTLMETSADSIYVLDERGDLQEANAAFLRRRGYTVAEAKSLNVADWDAKWTREQLEERMRTWVDGGGVFETQHRCKAGSVFDVEVGVTRVRIREQTLFFCVTRDITDRKRTEEAIRKANLQLRTLSRRRIQEQEEERRRLSRELHDQIGQSLTAAKLNVEALRSTTNPALIGRLDETTATLDQLLDQVRQISLDLRPPMLDDLGLVPALRSWLDEQGRRASVAVRFSAENIPEKLDPEIQITCFRIAQEAITNAVRHAAATRIDIALRCARGKKLRLLVRDNGIGFKARLAQAKADDLGLIGMKERAALVGGRARIMSLPRKGTTISVSLPLAFRPERQSRPLEK